MGEESSLEQKIDWNEAFKQVVELIKAGKPTTSNKSIDLPFFPKGAKQLTKGKFLGHHSAEREVEEDNVASDLVEALHDYFGSGYKGSVGHWTLYVEWDVYKSTTSDKIWIKDLWTRAEVDHTVPGTSLDIKAEIKAQGYENEPPRIIILFTCDYAGVFKNTSYSRVCEIIGPKGSFR